MMVNLKELSVEEIKNLSVEEIIQIFQSSDISTCILARAAFINACPSTKWAKDKWIAAVIRSPERCANANALDLTSLGCLANGAFELGAKLGEAGYRLAKEDYTSGCGDKMSYHSIAGRCVLNWMDCLLGLGRHKEVGEKIKEPINWLTSIGEHDMLGHDMLGSVLLKQVQAEYVLENYDEADKLLRKIDKKTLSSLELKSYQTHKFRIAQHRGGGTILPEEVKDTYPKDLEEVASEINFEELEASTLGDSKLEDLDEVLSGINLAASAPKLEVLTKFLSGKEDKRVDDETLGRYLQLKQIYSGIKDIAGEKVEKYFGGSDNEFTVRQRIIEANQLFMDPQKGRDSKEIEKIIPVLQEGRKWMKEHHLPDYENEASWGLSLCYRRTNREDLAAKELLRIRSNIEKARSKVEEPLERARLSEFYPYLYADLCKMLYKTLHTPELRKRNQDLSNQDLLEAIEASKARILADLQTRKTGRSADDREFTKAVKELPGLMNKFGAHYFTTFVDDDGIYCVIVTQSGEIRSKFVEIERETLEWLASIRDPRIWGNKYPSEIPSDVPQRLAPIVSWLLPLYKSGLLKSGDHICYSPHDVLLAIPFHYIDFDGKPMVEYFSMSRIHGAHTLVETLCFESTAPSSFIAVQVPSTHDRRNPKKMAAFERPVNWLKANLAEIEILKNEEADIIHLGNLVGNLGETALQNRVVHFATHGIFPEHNSIYEKFDPNPYRFSGVLLSVEGILPDFGQLQPSLESQLHLSLEERKYPASLLTPEKILQRNLDFSRSHITLQACVSGLSKRGYGGDALGLEWAFLQYGATSILSTHWHVSAQKTSEFIIRFYNKWLNKNESRANAWRKTMLDLLGEPETSNPYDWAAFSLSGDWR